MSEELSGIVKEDPTFVPNMEPKGFFGLQIMRDVTKVLEDCFEVEQACIGASTACLRSCDLRWQWVE